jgi:chitodextrinase/CubicO group peptidase (beta-lactamase class C family)
MIQRLSTQFLLLALLVSVAAGAYAGSDLGNIGTFHKWHKVEIELGGPSSSVTATPNPFEIVVNVTFTGPGGTFSIPAFYDGNGSGGTSGNVWKVRFSANAIGSWTFSSSSANATLNGYTGSFAVIDAPASATNLFKWGRLKYVGGHYLKFADGPYWIKGGIDDPENILGNPYGFDNWTAKKAEIDKLGARKVNSIYVMFNTISPGDGNDCWPWWGSTSTEAKSNPTRFNPAKLLAWEDFFLYCNNKGVVLHFVFDDDSAWAGYNRTMFYREMIARFGYLPGVLWNIGEEADELYTNAQQIEYAGMIKSMNSLGSPVTVHRKSTSTSNWPFLGNANFDFTSIQTNPGGATDFTTATLDNNNAIIINNRNGSISAGRPIAIMIDEPPRVTTVNSTTRLKLRSQVLYPIFLGGGHFELHFQDQFTQGGSTTFDTLAPMFDDMRIAREFTESLPFDQMSPNNSLLSSTSGNFCFAKPGLAYGIYLTSGGTVSLNLNGVTGAFQVKWHNVTTGATSNGPIIFGGAWRSLGAPAYSGDVACSVVRTVAYPGSSWSTATPSELGVDSSKLSSFASGVGGNGMVVKDGYIVNQFGTPTTKIDWASASKPTNVTALFIALAEGRTTMDTPIYPGYWSSASGKDRNITFRHMANMLSGYMRPENPGSAWSYSDYNVNLFTKTLYQKVFGSDPQTIMTSRLSSLQFQDSPAWNTGSNYGRLSSCSGRDLARIGWMWANSGKWGSSTIVPSTYFDQYCKVHVSSSVPRSSGSDSSDYLGIGTYGGGTNQTAEGPGEYGYFWWQNDNGYWPDAPRDTFMADGHWGGECMAMIPSLGIVAVSDGNWGGLDSSTRNNLLKLLKESVVTPGMTDTEAPTIPSNVVADILSENMVQIRWAASVDNLAVKNYKVFRNGTLLGTSATQTYTDPTVAPGPTYFYTVSAVDFAGNESAQSVVARAELLELDMEPPSVPSNVQATPLSETSIEVTWSESTDNYGVAGYKVYRNGSLTSTTALPIYQDANLQPNTSYSYTISAYDAADNESGQSSPPAVATTLADTQAPSVPEGVAATTLSMTAIRITWAASTDNLSVAGYKVYRDGAHISSPTTVVYTDIGLEPGTAYSYTVSAYDGSGNESAQSSPPAVAMTLFPQVTASIDLGSTDVNNYLSRLAPSGGGTGALNAGGLNCRQPSNTSNQYFYFAIDDTYIYNGSVLTTYLEVCYYDDLSGSAFIEPQYDSSIGTYTVLPQVTLTGTGKWKTATWTLTDCLFANGQSGGADFRLYVGPNSVKIDSVRISKIPFSHHNKADRDIGINEVYSGISHPQFTDGNTIVVLKDGIYCKRPTVAGNNYFYFNVSDAIIYDGSSPTVYLKIGYYDSEGGLITPQYDSASDPYTSADTLNFTGTNTWKEHIWTLTDAKFANRQNVSADFRLFVGTAQNVFIDTVVVSTVPFGDITGPSAPTNVTATALSTSAINISWSASTDDSGIMGYRVFRGPVEIGCTTATSFTDTGLATGATYSYTVMAYDLTGNQSALSSPPAVASTLSSMGMDMIKQLPDSAEVSLSDQVVTAVFADCLYIGDPDRYSGIKVVPAEMPVGIDVGKTVDISGWLDTINGERQISNATVGISGS